MQYFLIIGLSKLKCMIKLPDPWLCFTDLEYYHTCTFTHFLSHLKFGFICSLLGHLSYEFVFETRHSQREIRYNPGARRIIFSLWLSSTFVVMQRVRRLLLRTCLMRHVYACGGEMRRNPRRSAIKLLVQNISPTFDRFMCSDLESPTRDYRGYTGWIYYW